MVSKALWAMASPGPAAIVNGFFFLPFRRFGQPKRAVNGGSDLGPEKV